MKEGNVLMLFAIVALVMAIVSAGVTYLSVSNFVSQMTGMSTAVATVNLTVESSSLLNFSIESINWGPGRVNATAGCAKAHLDTQSGTVTCGNWTAVTKPLLLVNVGNVNVTLNLSVTKTAAQLLGGSAGGGPLYKWNVSNNETGSCNGGLGASLGVFGNPNVTTANFCANFGFLDTADEIEIYINLTVPSDSFTGPLGDIITATYF